MKMDIWKMKNMGSYIDGNGQPQDIIGLEHNGHIDIKIKNPLTGAENMESHHLSSEQYSNALDSFSDLRGYIRR